MIKLQETWEEIQTYIPRIEWIPAHCDFEQHDEVDELAKKTMEQNINKCDNNEPQNIQIIEKNSAEKIVRDHMKKKSLKEWKKRTTHLQHVYYQKNLG